MKIKERNKNLIKMKKADLEKEAFKCEKNLKELRVKIHGSKTNNYAEYGKLKKELARIYTYINQTRE